MLSRFLDELSEEHAEVVIESGGHGYGRYGMANGGYGASRFDEAASPFDYEQRETPGWWCAQTMALRGRGPQPGAAHPVGDRGRACGGEHGHAERGFSAGRARVSPEVRLRHDQRD